MTNNYDELYILVKSAQTGDTRVFHKIFQIIEPIMTVQASAILKSSQEVEDAVQESFIRIWNNIHKVGDPMYFIPWVKKVTTNISITILNGNQDILSDDIEVYLDSENITTSDVLDDYLEEEYRNEMLDLIYKMDTNIAHTVYLRYYRNLSIKEIAATLCVPEGTVKSRLHSGKKQLKNLMKNDKRFHPFMVGIVPVGAVLSSKTGSNVVMASNSKNIIGAVAMTGGLGAAAFALTYTGSLATPVSGDLVSVVEADPMDSILPELELISYEDSTLVISVSDFDSGIDYSNIYCELESGLRIHPVSVDTDTDYIYFNIFSDDFLIYVWDNAGNYISQKIQLSQE